MLKQFWGDNTYKVISFFRSQKLQFFCPEYLQYLFLVEDIVVDMYQKLVVLFPSDKRKEIPLLEFEEISLPTQVSLRVYSFSAEPPRDLWVGSSISSKSSNRLVVLADCASLMGDIQRYRAEHLDNVSQLSALSKRTKESSKSAYEVYELYSL